MEYNGLSQEEGLMILASILISWNPTLASLYGQEELEIKIIRNWN